MVSEYWPLGKRRGCGGVPDLRDAVTHRAASQCDLRHGKRNLLYYLPAMGLREDRFAGMPRRRPTGVPCRLPVTEGQNDTGSPLRLRAS